MNFEGLVIRFAKEWHHWKSRNCPQCDDGAGPCDCDVLRDNMDSALEGLFKATHLLKYPTSRTGPEAKKFLQQCIKDRDG